ncbi:MAG: hypothetical protein QOE54_117, partial [Streptosporangiaceae bacterium]|nr:hypothetical protein [Streptosporangiaceae bacterium]
MARLPSAAVHSRRSIWNCHSGQSA